MEVFTEYFKVLEEESIRDNFVIIYELLDEMMDFGYPQTTESKILQEYDGPIYATRSDGGSQLTSPWQIHYPRITQAGDPGPTAHCCHQCRVMAK